MGPDGPAADDMSDDAPEQPTRADAAPPRAPAPRAGDPAVHRAVRAGAILAGGIAAAAALWLAREVVLLGFLAVLVAVVFSFPVAWLSRVVPRGAAVLLVLAILFGALAGVAALAAPTISRQAAQLSETVPRTVRDVRRRLERVQQQAGGPPAAARPSPAPAPSSELVGAAGAKAAEAAYGVLVVLTEGILVLVLAAFLVYRPEVYRRGLRRLVPPAHEATFDEAWARVRDRLRGWVGGILVAMLLMGTAAGIGLLAVGVEDWLLLALLTFLGTFVPYVGAVASAVPGLLVALAQSPRTLGLAALVYLGVHVLEGYIVEPVVMRRAVSLRPALLLFGQGVFGAVFGLLGFVVATPAIVCGQTLVEYLWVERRLRKA